MQGRIPRDFIDELLQRLDIVEIIDRRVPLKKAGKDYKACCPFHDEKTPSFTVSPDKQFYHCFGCGASGTAITFLMEYGHLPFPEAVEDLASEVGLTLPETASPSTPSREVGDLFAVNEKANKLFKSQLRDSSIASGAIDYLKGRGLSGEVAREFELGFAPESWDRLVNTAANDAQTLKLMEKAGLISKRNSGGYYDRFRSRIIFPIHDQRARVIGFGGRIVGDGEPKYLNSPETPVFHKGSELYNLHRAKAAIARKNAALVVEGYMDVVALAQFGIENAVAALGTATTRTHLTRLFRLTPAVVFCFDGDRAGRDAAWRALDVTLGLMEGGRQVSFLFLPEGEDPDSIVRGRGPEAFERMVEEATSLPDFLFSSLEAQTDLSRLDGRARLVELAKPYLAKLPSGALQDLMWQRLSEISGVNHHRVRSGSGGKAKSKPLGKKAKYGRRPTVTHGHSGQLDCAASGFRSTREFARGFLRTERAG